jgi:hypothetical protein
MNTSFWRRAAIVLVCAAPACVDDAKTDPNAGADAGADKGDATGPLLPWKVGNKWEYKVTDPDDGVSDKVTTIGDLMKVGGSGPHKDDMAYEVTTLKSDGTDKTVSYQIDMDDKVVRYRELSYEKSGDDVELEEHWDPYKLHIDGTPDHTKPEATWLESYTETKLPAMGSSSSAEQRDRWTLDQTDATVTVPAGTFKHALVFTKAGGGDLKTYWYVRGVGKIKETGGQTEELVSYEVTP